MKLHVHAMEGGRYLAAVESGSSELKEYLRGEDQAIQTFSCLSQLREQVEAERFEEIWLHHASAYDEMCGTSEAAGEMCLQLHW
ncbi:DUF6482 family protein [Aliagarivorans marinus]|uniref:DUF6482 family protein n=1 Tax=Aliagarivorans marinus TaxID=561965 RepID=UPI000406AFB5|nr:DUF6482 family protein [Aliagarivorans marinus]